MRRLLLLLFISLNITGFTYGETKANYTEVPTVTVNATAKAAGKTAATGNQITITQQQIQQSGATNLAELLVGQSGVQLFDLNGDGSSVSVSMRGFGSNATSNSLILVNGIPMMNPDQGAPDLNQINIANIAKIEIMPNSAGTLYGNQAVGGVINIITKKPKKLTVNGALGYGSYQHRLARAVISDRLKNGLSYRISAIKNKSNNYRDHDDFDRGNIAGLLKYDYQTGSAYVKYQYLEKDQQYPGALTRQQ